MILTVQPARPILITRTDGMGYELRTAYDGHHCQLQIGNVSIAFDGRNNWKAQEGYDGIVIEFGSLKDDPVRLDGVSCPPGDTVAETILLALAADLGYTVNSPICGVK